MGSSVSIRDILINPCIYRYDSLELATTTKKDDRRSTPYFTTSSNRLSAFVRDYIPYYIKRNI